MKESESESELLCTDSTALVEINILHTMKRREVNWIGHM
jgi:hypothetical protein